MFNKARMTLTLWYLLIIMTISISFSVVIYRSATFEIQRALSFQRFRIENPESESLFPPFSRRIIFFDPQVLEESKRRIGNGLFLINAVILITSGTAGYFLAGKTLKPIKEMVDDQNRFISDASHELRTPLTSLITETEVSLREKHPNLKSAVATLKDNLEELQDLKKLSDNLLELSNFQQINGSLILETISLSEVIKKTIDKMKPVAKQKNIQINFSNDSNIKVKGNPDKLTELIIILLDNAIKYSPEKSIVEISVKKQKANALIQVIDHGIGIDQDDLGNIFDRFYRSDRSRQKNKQEGYGLGLAIAKKIAETHKGTIEVTSKINEGSAFSISLPLIKV